MHTHTHHTHTHTTHARTHAHKHIPLHSTPHKHAHHTIYTNTTHTNKHTTQYTPHNIHKHHTHTHNTHIYTHTTQYTQTPHTHTHTHTTDTYTHTTQYKQTPQTTHATTVLTIRQTVTSPVLMPQHSIWLNFVFQLLQFAFSSWQDITITTPLVPLHPEVGDPVVNVTDPKIHCRFVTTNDVKYERIKETDKHVKQDRVTQM